MRKHINFYTLAASCLLVFAACTNSKLDIETESDYFYNDDPAAASLVAVTQSDLQEDAETKSMLSSNGNNPDVLWTSGDQISVLQFQGDEYVNIPFTTTADKKTSASFTEDETGSYDREQTSVSYAVYPYSSDTKISVVDETVTITTEIPTTQFITENTFAEEANIAVGKVEGGNVNFKNACAYLRFQASNGGRVKSLTISGKNGEYIAGKVNITFDGDGNPVAKAIEGVSSKTVTLTCPEGTDAFAAGKPYYVAVIPDVFENGVVLTVETVNDNLTVGSTDISYTRTLTRTSKNTRMTLTRNTVKRFPYWDDKFEWRSAMLFDCENSADASAHLLSVPLYPYSKMFPQVLQYPCSLPAHRSASDSEPRSHAQENPDQAPLPRTVRSSSSQAWHPAPLHRTLHEAVHGKSPEPVQALSYPLSQIPHMHPSE